MWFVYTFIQLLGRTFWEMINTSFQNRDLLNLAEVMVLTKCSFYANNTFVDQLGK